VWGWARAGRRLGRPRERQRFRVGVIAGVRGIGVHGVGGAGAAASWPTATLPVHPLPRALFSLYGHARKAGIWQQFRLEFFMRCGRGRL